MTAPSPPTVLRPRLRERSGFTLVETLVAAAVLGVSGLAMVATLALTFSLLRAASEVLAALDEAPVAAVCGALAVPRARGRRRAPAAAQSKDALPSRRSQRLGFTLIETLLVLMLTTLLLLVVAALVRSAGDGRQAIEGRAERHLLEHGLRLVLEGELARAGGGLLAEECGVAASPDARRLDAWWRDGGTLHQVTYTAGVDGAGRPALYRRHHPFARQPWLEDVTTFELRELETSLEGDAVRIVAIVVELQAGADARVLRWRIELPHRPCQAEAPA